MVICGRYRCVSCMQELPDDSAECSCGFGQGGSRNPVHCLQEGSILWNRYVIGKVIGEGGFGITYVGWDCKHDVKVAIKEFFLNGFSTRNSLKSSEIRSTTGDGAECFAIQREKFFNEAEILVKFLNEPGVVNVYKFFRDNNTAYIVMEFVEGITLKEYLATNGKISLDETLGIMGPIMNSLGKIHEYNLIHRDISPDNIMITRDGRGKLIDFGAARDVSVGHKSLSVVLKHGFAPIEQYQSRGNQGPWTDVYALSATMYRCITGKVPADAVNRLSGEELVHISQLEPNCLPEVANVIMTGLGLTKEERYQTVKQLKADILNALNMNSKSQNELALDALKSEDMSLKGGRKKRDYSQIRNTMLGVLMGITAFFTLIFFFAYIPVALFFLIILIGLIVLTLVLNCSGKAKSRLRDRMPGDIIEFGKNNGNMQWVVLNRIDDRLLIISNEIIATMAYDNKGGRADWSASTVREWLLGDFYMYAFDEKERARICPVVNESGTTDTLFLLSRDEYKMFFEERNMPNMKYEQPLWWWLRSSSHNDGMADFISERGYIKDYGFIVNDEHGGVRPAMWISI